MNFDQPNIIVKDIFTDEEIRDIYTHIESIAEDNKFLNTFFGHMVYAAWLPEDIVNKIIEKAQSTTDVKLQLEELSFARYSGSYGVTPNLSPHWDETFREPRLTFDIQVAGTMPWPLVVEGREYVLEDNQALTFSGNHQIHWRKKLDFGPTDYMDMIFCHFRAADAEPGSLGDQQDFNLPYNKFMLEKRDAWIELYNKNEV